MVYPFFFVLSYMHCWFINILYIPFICYNIIMEFYRYYIFADMNNNYFITSHNRCDFLVLVIYLHFIFYTL